MGNLHFPYLMELIVCGTVPSSIACSFASQLERLHVYAELIIFDNCCSIADLPVPLLTHLGFSRVNLSKHRHIKSVQGLSVVFSILLLSELAIYVSQR